MPLLTIIWKFEILVTIKENEFTWVFWLVIKLWWQSLIDNAFKHVIAILNRISRDIKIKFRLHYERYEVSQGSPGLNERSDSRVFMGVENDWHRWLSRETTGSSLFGNIYHVIRCEIRMKWFYMVFMGIKMTAQLEWVHFRWTWIISMTSWSKCDVISKNCIRPFFYVKSCQ